MPISYACVWLQFFHCCGSYVYVMRISHQINMSFIHSLSIHLLHPATPSTLETLGTHTISQRVLTEVEHIITEFRNTLLHRLDIATTSLEEQQRVIAWLVQLDCGMDPAWYYLKKQKVREGGEEEEDR